jgi:hypothetical protein
MQDLTEIKLFSKQQQSNTQVQMHDIPLSVDFAAAVGQLQHLTSLYVECITPAGCKLLPTSLRSLTMFKACADTVSTSDDTESAESACDVCYDLTHLTSLSQLLLL